MRDDFPKTAPGLRALDKYAVTAGGGGNHRLTLAAMVLLKENHITAAGGVTAAIDAVRKGMADSGRSLPIDVEVQTVAQAREAMEAGAGWLMLDNMEMADIEEVTRMRARRRGGSKILLEASGNVTLHRVRAVAEAGVDLISIGALTHRAP
ncbi:nicotinate-nucleotide diphosphorylase, partial [Kitasatospora sp. NPDC058263]